MQRFRQYVNETNDVWPGKLIGKWVAPHKIDNRFRGADHDLALKRQLLHDCGTQSRFAHILAHNERADRADVHDPELRQLLGDLRRLTSICAADVYRTEKYHPPHLNYLITGNAEFAEKTTPKSVRRVRMFWGWSSFEIRKDSS